MLLAIDWGFLLEKFVLILVVVMGSLVIAMYTTYAERKVAAILQDRRGPNRAGPFGLLQPVADGLKLFFKEEIIPNFSSKFLFILGPALAMLTAIMTGAIVPWGNVIHFFGRDIQLQIADVDVGILYVFAVVSMGVYGIMIGGWASNNKYSIMGGMRAASQIISYELGNQFDCPRYGNRQFKHQANGCTAATGDVEFLLSTPWLFDLFNLCICRV